MGKFLQHHPGADPFAPLDNLADVLVWLVWDEHMDVIARHLPCNNVNLVLDGNLPQYVPRSDRHLARQHPLPLLGNPDQMHLQVRFCMCPLLVTSHSDTYYLHFA